MSIHANILFIEEEFGIREALYEAALSLHGYRVIPATTAQEAENIKQHLGPDGIDVVIADIHLPSDPGTQNGYTLYQRWTAEHPDLPFILVSGNPGCRELPAISAGAVCFLEKPFPSDTLLEAVRTTLGGRIPPSRTQDYS